MRRRLRYSGAAGSAPLERSRAPLANRASGAASISGPLRNKRTDSLGPIVEPIALRVLVRAVLAEPVLAGRLSPPARVGTGHTVAPPPQFVRRVVAERCGAMMSQRGNNAMDYPSSAHHSPAWAAVACARSRARQPIWPRSVR
jgi:hypothetical protein